jgi:GNAT superfamily N-acetyltransferase
MIVPAQTGEHLEHLISLAHEYVTWMAAEIQRQYPELDLAEFTSEHAYDDLRKKFPGEHVCLLIAMHDSELCGCVALGHLSEAICEVRTLYVRPACRGMGIGKLLVQAALDQARTLGYHTARLDTLAFMHGAQQLYRSLGFYDIEPYLDLSDSLKQYIRFFEMKLIPPYDHRSAERLARFS